MDGTAIRLREYEREIQRKVNRALSAIEVALAQWEMSPEKAEDMAGRIEVLKRFHQQFSEWERMSIIEYSARQDAESSAERLEQFADLCTEFEGYFR